MLIDIIAPASHSAPGELEAALKWAKANKLSVRVPKDLIKPDVFFSSDLKNQIKQIKNALYAKDSEMIWCLRGGYGSMRLIPEMMKWEKPKKEKIFMGYSDITSLHLFLNQKWSWTTYHGPTFSFMPKKDASAIDVIDTFQLITNKKIQGNVFHHLKPLNQSAKTKNALEGKMTGGNLRIVQSSFKTPWEIKTKNKILFFEDVGERGYSLDRMLEQMIQAGAFKQALAVIFGDFTEGLEKDGKDLKNIALNRFAQKIKIPVFQGIPCGHGEINRILPFNQNVILETGKTGTLLI
jgi:muramoyltetrapeptide carboxypeptidase